MTATRSKRAFIKAPMPPKHPRPTPSDRLDGYFLSLEPRVSLHEAKEIELQLQVRKEWYARGGCWVRDGSLSPNGPVNSLLLPEADPEKVLALSQIFEIGFIQDDWMDEDLMLEIEPEKREAMQKKFKIILNQLQGKAIVDYVNAFPAFTEFAQAYGGWLSRSLETHQLKDLEILDLDEYLVERYYTFGWKATSHLIPHLYDITLTDELYDAVLPLDKLGGYLSAIVNDILSVEREWIARIKLNQSAIPASAVYIILRTHDVTVSEAKEIAKKKILELEGKYLELRQQLLDNTKLPHDIRKYISGIDHMVSGNLVWHTGHPRYNYDADSPFCPKPEHKLRDFPLRDGKTLGDYSTINSCSTTTPSEIESASAVADHLVNGYVQKHYSEESTSSSQISENFSDESTLLTSDDESLKSQPIPSPWTTHYSNLSEELVLKPFEYVKSLPSKKIRHYAINALDIYYQAPQSSVDIITDIVDILHSSSLIIDDIEDDSPLRRGNPAAHMVFGTSQSINAANFLFVKALQEVQKLPHKSEAIAIFTDELRNLHVGQGFDLNWTFFSNCPSVEDYIRMIDGKTGGLFKMACRLMQLEATQNRDLDVQQVLLLMGRFFQIRDDYQNLSSATYSKAKGDLSDLDEGKFSLMIIHALTSAEGDIHNTDQLQMKSLLQLRSRQGSLTAEQKQLLMKLLNRSKSLEYTLGVLERLQSAIHEELQRVELRMKECQESNWLMRAIMVLLRVGN